MVARQLGVTIGAEHEQPQRRVVGGHVPQQRERGRIGPVQVVEYQHHGRVTRRQLEQARDGAEKQVALSFRVGLTQLGVVGQPAADLRDKLRELPSVLLGVGTQDLVRRLHHVMPEGADPRAVGHAEVLVAAAVQHRRAVAVGVHGELGGETGLPDPRLAGNERDAPGALARLIEQERESLALHVAADVTHRRHLAQSRG